MTAPPYRGNEVVPPSHHTISYSSVGPVACPPGESFFLGPPSSTAQHRSAFPSAVALSGNRAMRGTLMRKHEGSKQLARKLSRERVARALEHPDVLAILLAHEVATAEHKRARRRRRQQSSATATQGEQEGR